MSTEITSAKEYGLRCRRFRQLRGMSQQQLADAIHMTPQAISKYEKNGISDIEIIQQLSNVLGYNLLSDETDTEGTVGDVGREILRGLVNKGGFRPFQEVSKDLFGMNENRIIHEVFKLMRIGLVVREQYTGFCDEERDYLFITAKGIIAYLNAGTFRPTIDENIESYESLIGDAGSYQNYVDGRRCEKLIRNVFADSSYRVNYITYLKKYYEKGFEFDCTHIEECTFTDDLVPGEGFYFDLLYRMALKLDREKYEFYLDYQIDPYKCEDEHFELEEEISGVKHDVEWIARGKFERHIPDIRNEKEPDLAEKLLQKENLTAKEERFLDLECGVDYFDFSTAIKIWKQVREERKEESAYPTDWFSVDEIRKFIEENLMPTIEEDFELNEKLLEINRENPQTLDYYEFPASWEDNGLADLVRKIYGIDTLFEKGEKE